MEQLLEIKGGIEFFLMSASAYVNWEGSNTDIQRDKLITVAAAVNSQFGTKLNCFDIKLTWAQLRALWETWVRATHYVHLENVNATAGKINIDEFAWDQLVRVVPDAEVFQRKPMISANMVCSVFNRTPPSLAPEELHSRGHLNMSPEEVEKEIDACMREVCKIYEPSTSEIYIDFCIALFREGEFRRCFNLLPNKTLKHKYVVLQYNLNLAP